jgi:RNA polymerase sigma-70 factor, ECF subfamily
MPEVALQLTHPAQADDDELLDALRQGDEDAYVALVRRYGGLMQRVALSYVRTPAVAEEVVQETWCAVLTGLERFEGRAALKTWLFRILTNRAKTRGQREARTVPFSSLAGEDDGDGPAVDPDRFLPADHPRWPGHWASGPARWSAVPDERLLAGEVRTRIREAIDTLPERQAGGHRPARRGWLAARGGLPGARRQRGQPARAAAPRALEGARAARTLLRRRSRGPDGMTDDLDLACNELVELVTAYVEGALAAGERARFDAHLTECPDCVEYVAQLHRTIVAMRLAAPELERTPPVAPLLRVFRDWKRGLAVG